MIKAFLLAGGREGGKEGTPSQRTSIRKKKRGGGIVSRVLPVTIVTGREKKKGGMHSATGNWVSSKKRESGRRRPDWWREKGEKNGGSDSQITISGTVRRSVKREGRALCLIFSIKGGGEGGGGGKRKGEKYRTSKNRRSLYGRTQGRGDCWAQSVVFAG